MGSGIPFGEYTLLKRLGSGGMAEVFLAKRSGPGGFEKKLVIKRILPHLSASNTFTSLFLNEARLAALIDHPNVVHVSGFGEIEGTFYLAMEFIDGVTVAELLRLLGSISPGMAARIVIETLEGLYAIHTTKDDAGRPLGLIHRDVSARNVMVTRGGAVKLLDFGIAVSERTDASTEKARRMGTRAYMSPEQLAGKEIDLRSDLYAVAVLLFELVTGQLPDLSEGLRRPEDLPDELFEVLGRAMSQNPDDRPFSARDFGRSLELFVATRGLEGTSAHLGEVIESLAPSLGPVGRAVTLITRMTRAAPSVPALRAPDRQVPKVIAAAGLGFVTVAAYFVTVALRSPPDRAVERSVAVETASVTHTLASTNEVRVLQAELVSSSTKANPIAVKEAPRLPSRSSKSRKVKPPELSGQLTIDTRPWTEVYFEGQKLGVTPLSEVRLPAGAHELEVRNEDLGVSQKLTITIEPGKVTRINRAL